jgi:hypothetical protein
MSAKNRILSRKYAKHVKGFDWELFVYFGWFAVEKVFAEANEHLAI